MKVAGCLHLELRENGLSGRNVEPIECECGVSLLPKGENWIIVGIVHGDDERCKLTRKLKG
jgi:hypothetical protein